MQFCEIPPHASLKTTTFFLCFCNIWEFFQFRHILIRRVFHSQFQFNGNAPSVPFLSALQTIYFPIWSAWVCDVQTFWVYQSGRQEKGSHTPPVSVSTSVLLTVNPGSIAPCRPTSLLPPPAHPHPPRFVPLLAVFPSLSGSLCSGLLRCLELIDSTQNEIRSALLCQTGTRFLTHLHFHSFPLNTSTFFFPPFFTCHILTALVFSFLLPMTWSSHPTQVSSAATQKWTPYNVTCECYQRSHI